jgi:hypothetical protein
MALKGDRHELQVDVAYFNNDVSERGVILVYGQGGGSGSLASVPSASGAAMDNAQAVVSLAANPSGLTPAGLLLNNQVNIDQTRQHINFMRDEMIVGGKCALLRQGWVVTNKVTGSPAAGNKAYLTANGNLTPTLSATGGLKATPQVGEFMGALDESGFVKVAVHLPY